MLNNYHSHILEVEADKRERYGIDVVLKKRVDITKNGSKPTPSNVSDFYSAPVNPDESYYSYDILETTIRAIVHYITQEELEKLPVGVASIGDANLEMSLDYLSDIKQAIKNPTYPDIGKEDIVIDGNTYNIISENPNDIRTHMMVFVRRKLTT